MTPFLIFRTLLILVAGAAFVRLLGSHPVGILAMGLAAMGSFVWLLVDLHRLASHAIGGF